MSQQSQHMGQFQVRLKRIAAGGPNTLGHVYVGITGQGEPRQRFRVPRLRAASIVPLLIFPFTFVGALSIGLVSVLLARLVRVQFYGGGLTGDQAEMLMLMDASMALIFAFILRWMFQYRAPVMKSASTIGVACMIVAMHNFVHLAPDIFSVVFPAEWVRNVIVTTEMDSVLFRGISFTS
jgi:hypothetical protein